MTQAFRPYAEEPQVSSSTPYAYVTPTGELTVKGEALLRKH